MSNNSFPIMSNRGCTLTKNLYFMKLNSICTAAFHNQVLNLTSMEIWIDRRVYLNPWTNQEMSGQSTYSHVTRMGKEFHFHNDTSTYPVAANLTQTMWWEEFLYNFCQSSIKPWRAKLLYNREESASDDLWCQEVQILTSSSSFPVPNKLSTIIILGEWNI